MLIINLVRNMISSKSFFKWFVVISSTFSTYLSAEIVVEHSGFGTVGYAVSDSPYNYLKYIDENGTFLRDSLLGGQIDIKFNSKFSFTAQGIISANDSQDSGFEGDISWAFLSYRPTNDWLFRVGKLQIPGYLNSENRNIQITYDYARLPAEVDSASPVYDFTGLSVNKSFELDDGEIIVDFYTGKSKTDWRVYLGDSIPEIGINRGSEYSNFSIDFVGGALSYRGDENFYIAGFHRAIIRNEDGFTKTFGFQELIPELGIGFYNTEEAFGATFTDAFKFDILNLGFDISLGNDFRLASEYIVRNTDEITTGLSSILHYVSLKKEIGKWTPYLLYSYAKTDDDNLKLYEDVDSTQVPNGVIPTELLSPQQIAIINTSQHLLADAQLVYDQYSISLGTSYRLSPLSKLKAEVTLTRIGVGSSLVDAISEDDISNSDITTLSFSYSFAF